MTSLLFFTCILKRAPRIYTKRSHMHVYPTLDVHTTLSLSIYIYMYTYMTICICVCMRNRKNVYHSRKTLPRTVVKPRIPQRYPGLSGGLRFGVWGLWFRYYDGLSGRLARQILLNSLPSTTSYFLTPRAQSRQQPLEALGGPRMQPIGGLCRPLRPAS